MSRQRRTKQQTTIEAIFDRTERPLNPQEVFDLASAEIPSIGMATVYRALNHMVDADQLRVVELPGQTARYESAGLNHHHHFHCLKCDRVFDLDGCMLKADLNLPKGFVVRSHDITLSGICPDCGS